MNKNELIKRLKEQESAHQVDDYSEGFDDGIVFALELAVRLDEPETLSEKWIFDNQEMYIVNDTSENAVNVWRLKNLIVPESEKPVVPEFVADFIKENKGRLNVFGAFIDIRDNEDSEMWEWMFNNYNQDEFAKAWIAYPNIEVEKEQKYYVKDDKGNILLMKVTKGFGIGDRKGEVVNSLNVGEASDIELTEKEIKDYDERFWAFAVPVEEEEE